MAYFSNLYHSTKQQNFLKNRKYRLNIFETGDILSLFFRIKYSSFFFNGLCIATKKKNTLNFSFLVFNVLSKIAVEVALLFFVNRIFQYRLSDYRRKAFFYNRAKLYYLKHMKKFSSIR